jgi:ribosomal protein S18 acetylase RimI-like enzyme
VRWRGELSLRPATSADLPWLEETFVAAFLGFAGLTDVKLRAAFREERDLRVTDVIVADGTAVGYIVIEDHDDVWFVEMFVVAPAHQNRGIGTAVMEQIMDDAPVPVQLTVRKENPAARALYERLGFRAIGGDAERTRMEWRWDA